MKPTLRMLELAAAVRVARLPRLRRWTRRAGTVLSLFSAAGCYSYRTVPLDEVRPDVDVRLRVRPEASARVSQIIGYQIDDVEGRVVDEQSDTLLLAVPGQTAVLGGSVERFYQRVGVSVSDILQVQQRHLSQLKTYTSIAAAVAGATVVVVAAFKVVNGGGGTTPPIVNNRLVPPGLFRPQDSRAAGFGTPRAGLHLLLPLGRLPLGH